MAGKAAKRIYHSARWLNESRPAALDRAGWRCERCGHASRLAEITSRPSIRSGGADLSNRLKE